MLADTLPHVGGGTSPVAIAWDGDGKGFLHTLWPKQADGTYATSGIQIFHHVVGTDPAADTYVFGKGLSQKVEYTLTSSLDGAVQAATAADGDGVHASLYMRRSGDDFTLVATPDAGIGDSSDAGGAFVGDAFYAIAHKRDSRGEVVALVPGGTFASAKVVVPAGGVVIEGVQPVAGGFITRDVDGGEGSARLFAVDGKLRAQVPIPKVSTLTTIAGDPRGGPIVIGYFDYTTPNKWLAYDPAANTLAPTGIAETAPGDFSNIVAERGGVLAQAMIRGGGEYGEAWHQSARLATKTVSSDDLAACATWLGKNGYGNTRHLGIIGGSAGGFLMGLALTRNPELYRAVVSEVGFYDLVRVELTPNGAYNTPEFGTVKDPAQFAWMIKQSPYHNVRKGVAYPAVLLITGENDPRVEPYMSRKMAAMLQAVTGSSNPVLLLQRSGQGHGIGNSFDQKVEAATDIDAFFEAQLR
ncbi:MAG: hypothetical protein NVS3B28_16940 [Candidatus Velthaea sp.]